MRSGAPAILSSGCKVSPRHGHTSRGSSWEEEEEVVVVETGNQTFLLQKDFPQTGSQW